MIYAIGLDLGGTNIKGLAVTPAGRVLAEQALPTGDDAWRTPRSHRTARCGAPTARWMLGLHIRTTGHRPRPMLEKRGRCAGAWIGQLPGDIRIERGNWFFSFFDRR